MKIAQKNLINNLIEKTQSNIKTVKDNFSTLPLEKLNHKPNQDSWSILECLEHLNLYGDYYLPEIEKSLTKPLKNKDFVFKSGVFGNYFTKIMLPPKGKIKKMKAPKDKIPTTSNYKNLEILERFLKQQNQLLNLLEKAKTHNLSKCKTSISISKMIKLKTGDTFNFLIAHNIRHLNQAMVLLNLK